MATTYPLHIAAASGDIAKIQALLDEDMPNDDLNAESAESPNTDAQQNSNNRIINSFNDLHQTPLMVACLNGEATAGSVLAECGADMKLTDSEGNTALHLACSHGKRMVISMLLWGGSERDVVNEKGDTALHCAVRTCFRDAVWLLLENGAEESQNVKNKDGLTPLELGKKMVEDKSYMDNLDEKLKDNLVNSVKLLEGDESGAP